MCRACTSESFLLNSILRICNRSRRALKFRTFLSWDILHRCHLTRRCWLASVFWFVSRILHHFKVFLVIWWNLKNPSLFSFSFQLWFLCFSRIGCFSLRFFWQVWSMFWPNTVGSRDLFVHLCIDVRPEYILSKTHAWCCVNLSHQSKDLIIIFPHQFSSHRRCFSSAICLGSFWLACESQCFFNGVGKFVLGTWSFRVGIAWFLNMSCPVLLQGSLQTSLTSLSTSQDLLRHVLFFGYSCARGHTPHAR